MSTKPYRFAAAKPTAPVERRAGLDAIRGDLLLFVSRMQRLRAKLAAQRYFCRVTPMVWGSRCMQWYRDAGG
jgi:hypothetical protein